MREYTVKTEQDLIDLAAQGAIYAHHTSYARGYVSRKKGAERRIDKYEGKFGKGYTIYTPAYNTTNYCLKTYYIFTEKEQ